MREMEVWLWWERMGAKVGWVGEGGRVVEDVREGGSIGDSEDSMVRVGEGIWIGGRGWKGGSGLDVRLEKRGGIDECLCQGVSVLDIRLEKRGGIG